MKIGTLVRMTNRVGWFYTENLGIVIACKGEYWRKDWVVFFPKDSKRQLINWRYLKRID